MLEQAKEGPPTSIALVAKHPGRLKSGDEVRLTPGTTHLCFSCAAVWERTCTWCSNMKRCMTQVRINYGDKSNEELLLLYGPQLAASILLLTPSTAFSSAHCIIHWQDIGRDVRHKQSNDLAQAAVCSDALTSLCKAGVHLYMKSAATLARRLRA